MGLFSPQAIMNAASIINGGEDDDPLAAIRKKREEEEQRKTDLRRLLAAQMAMEQPVNVSGSPLQSLPGGLMNYFGGS
jgi:hypothetical protein